MYTAANVCMDGCRKIECAPSTSARLYYYSIGSPLIYALAERSARPIHESVTNRQTRTIKNTVDRTLSETRLRLLLLCLPAWFRRPAKKRKQKKQAEQGTTKKARATLQKYRLHTYSTRRFVRSSGYYIRRNPPLVGRSVCYFSETRNNE